MDEAQIKQKLQELVDDFNSRYSYYKSLSEPDIETKLIYELFVNILGWDRNDFRQQEKVRRGEKRGRADYGFYIGDRLVFFLEVKKVGIPLDKEADKQVISYALSKRIPFAISTNFEQMKIFCVEEADEGKKIFRVFTKPDDYIRKLQDLLLLSKESFQENRLLKEAIKEEILKKRVTIDKPLLNDLMSVRRLIANDIEKNYPKKYEANEKDEIVQRIIDRLIFMRRCEDVGINPESYVLRELQSLPDFQAYKKLKEMFVRYNEVYNSGLFTIGIDNDCDNIKIDGNIIRNLVGYLYNSKDGQYIYNFDWIDADVLGQVYEQYLGLILEQSKSGKSKLKEGQAHRKEQGIFYTPTYVVDYVVKNTLGEILKSKKIKAKDIKVLDCACGSGSFLIKAFDYLYKELSNGKEANQTKLDNQGAYSTKTQILKNNLYGVDLDNKAVEITKLNLLLKASEKNRKLPEEVDLHIRHGNSLVDDDNVKDYFKWERDFQEGSFDVVIGNPPYVRQEELAQIKPTLKKYKIYNGQNDLYTYFFEKGINLLKEGGLFGFIVSSKFIKTNYGRNLRQFILDNTKILQFIDFADLPVFSEATTYPCVIILEKSSKNERNKNNKILVSKLSTLNFSSLSKEIEKNSFYLKQSSLSALPWNMVDETQSTIKDKIDKRGVPLTKFINEKLYRGITTGYNEAFIIDEKIKNELIKKDSKSAEIIIKFLTGKDIKRYSTNFNNLYLVYTYTGINIDDYHAVKEYLLKFKTNLNKVWEVKHGKHPWYELRGCSYYDKFQAPKIIYPRINIRPNFTFDENKYFTQDSSFIIPSSSKYLLGVLNSKLMNYYAKQVCSLLRGGYYDYRYQYVELFPIVKPDKNTEEKINDFVNKMLEVNKKLNKFEEKNTIETAKLKEEIKDLDERIDQEVYKLYRITNKEKEIIENGQQT